jgi:hypothetical protein
MASCPLECLADTLQVCVHFLRYHAKNVDTRARPPSRTLVDPLDAFINGLWGHDIAQAAQMAHEAAQRTGDLFATAGRGAYLDQEELQRQHIPDPGAWGVWKIVEALVADNKSR